MRRILVIIAATATASTFADFEIVYSNVTNGPRGAYTRHYGSSVWDVLHLTSGGLLDGWKWTYYLSEDSPCGILSADPHLTLYNWNDGDPEFIIGISSGPSISLEPGESGTIEVSHFYQYFGDHGFVYSLDSTIMVRLDLYNLEWDGDFLQCLTGSVGTLLYDPPTVGESDPDFFVNEGDLDPACLEGDPVANVYFEVTLFRCDSPGDSQKYCTADIHPNDGDGVWNPLFSGDGDCAVTLDDLAQLLGHYGILEGATREEGDIHPEGGDGRVDLNDLAEMLGQCGESCN